MFVIITMRLFLNSNFLLALIFDVFLCNFLFLAIRMNVSHSR